MPILASYDEAFGPNNPHTIERHVPDYTWDDNLTAWDDDIVALVHSVISCPQRAHALVNNLVTAGA